MKKQIENLIVGMIVCYVGIHLLNKQMNPLEKFIHLPWSLI